MFNIFQVIKRHMDSQDTANIMNFNKIEVLKAAPFFNCFLRSTFAASWLPIIKVPQGNLLPKINFLAVSIQRNIYPFSPISEQNLDISATIG